ncbi:hypothetical protein A2U01_0088893, partial [Trifolium medium]|nr:hypothetical protein [Trifolium medium]
VVMGAVEQ